MPGIWFNVGTGCGLLPFDMDPLPEPIVIYDFDLWQQLQKNVNSIIKLETHGLFSFSFIFN